MREPAVPFHLRVSRVDQSSQRLVHEDLQDTRPDVVSAGKVDELNQSKISGEGSSDSVFVEVLIELRHRDVWQLPLSSKLIQAVPPLNSRLREQENPSALEDASALQQTSELL